VRVAVPWSGCVPCLKKTIWMHHFQGEFGGEDHHLFGEIERCLHRFWYQSLTPIYICMFSLIYSMPCFIVHYAYAMFIRLVIYMFSYSRHFMFYMDLYLCVLTWFLTNMYALDLMHMHLHNDHMDVL